MPRFLRYTFAGIILGLLVGVPLTYGLWQRQQYRNFHVVREGVLYRSGQLPLDGLQRLVYDRHIKTVVTLRYPAAPDKPAPDADEEKWCRSQGLHYFRLPYQSWSGREDEGGSVPAEANVRQFLDIMKDPGNYPVLVHCFAGVHRTGAMCAVYRMEFDHWSPEQAMEEMRKMGYTAHHQDVFAYLENYRPGGYAFDVAVGSPASHPADAGPWAQRLFVDGLEKDFGTVAGGTKLMHKFKITNVDAIPVEIMSVRTGMGCVTARPDSYKLEPGESTYLNVTMDCRRFHGQRSADVFVAFGPQWISEVKLSVAASVHPDIVFNPGAIEFGAVQRGNPVKRQMDVEFNGNANWLLEEIVKDSKAPFDLSVELLRKGSGEQVKKGFRIFATLKEDAPLGNFKQDVLLKIKNGGNPEAPADESCTMLTFTVTGTIQADPPAKQGALDILLPNSAPHRYAHLAQPGDVVQVDLSPNLPGLGTRFVVQPDGTLNLGKRGSVRVAGLQRLLIDLAAQAIEEAAAFGRLPAGSPMVSLAVDVFPRDDRPQTCRVIVKGSAGDQVFAMPWQATQRVRDVLNQIPDHVVDVDGCRAWIIRPPTTGKGPSLVRGIDWGALRRGDANATNWQTQCGDEIFVDATAVAEGQRKISPANWSRNRGVSEPDEAAILRALKPALRISYVHEESRSNFDFVVEKMWSAREPAKDFFLIGPAQVERSLWKCTVGYTEHVRILLPLPMRTQCRRQQVVYVDRDVLHIMSESDLHPIRVDGALGR